MARDASPKLAHIAVVDRLRQPLAPADVDIDADGIGLREH